MVVKVQSQALASQQEKKRGEVDDESEDIPDDVEIIDEEQIEEELEEEEEDEEISDVDDAELLSRLEAKYGRLPEPERYERKPSKSYHYVCTPILTCRPINKSMSAILLNPNNYSLVS